MRISLLLSCLLALLATIYTWHRLRLRSRSNAPWHTTDAPVSASDVAHIATPVRTHQPKPAFHVRPLQEQSSGDAKRLLSYHQHLKQLESSIYRVPLEQKFELLVQLGDVYARGFNPDHAPNHQAARECYIIAALTPYALTSALVKGKLFELVHNPVQVEEGQQLIPLPPQYGQRACAHCRTYLNATRAHRPQLKRQEQINVPNVILDVVPPVVTDHVPRPIIVERPARRPHVYQPDLQNAHDSSVVAGVTTNVARLQAHDANVFNDVTQDVAEAIAFSPDITETEVANAKRVLNALNTTTHGTFKTSDKKALQLVWDRIQKNDNPQERTNLIEQLGKQLATGVERNNVVCATGRIARIVGVLDGSDDTVVQQLRPIEAVKEELGTLAAQVRQEHLNNMNPQQIEAYNAGNDEQATQVMTNKYKQKAKEVYVDQLKMHEGVIEPLVNVYAEGF